MTSRHVNENREHLVSCEQDETCACGSESCQLCGIVVPAGQRLVVWHANGERTYIAGALCRSCAPEGIAQARQFHGEVARWDLSVGKEGVEDVR